MPITKPDRRIPIEAATRHSAHKRVKSLSKPLVLCPHTYYDLIFAKIFSIKEPFDPETADYFCNHIDQCLKLLCFRPRALYDRFNIEQVVTAESPLDDLRWHKLIQKPGWSGRIIPTYCPDNVVDPEHLNFLENLEHFADISGEDTSTWQGYLAAHK